MRTSTDRIEPGNIVRSLRHVDAAKFKLAGVISFQVDSKDGRVKKRGEQIHEGRHWRINVVSQALGQPHDAAHFNVRFETRGNGLGRLHGRVDHLDVAESNRVLRSRYPTPF
ncbi:hypothetical protein HC256_009559 [Beauveria bassiana]|nr:hypothetical protein HC256_009559 [Beauveria bassiana]